MKMIAAIRVMTSGLIIPLLSQETAIRIDARYKGVDGKWLADLSSSTRASLKAAGGAFRLPTVSARTGEAVAIEIIQEFDPGTSGSRDSGVPCGIVIEWFPNWLTERFEYLGRRFCVFLPIRTPMVMQCDSRLKKLGSI
ncbi:hypothetical protein HNR46_003574 [Haloferula luteola]|uniref:Uncharacterized protein n=1 Tax=Haloferula luteola TaxID=595692 RepID=A0A840VFB6_9BACT|nr:hypothetical protein [Haloferula luteola]MBB5353318.1 hypothetical protein [Haloferula luteola]